MKGLYTLVGPFHTLIKTKFPSEETKKKFFKYDHLELANFWFNELIWNDQRRIYLCVDPGLREFQYLGEGMRLNTDFDCLELVRDFEERIAPEMDKEGSLYDIFIESAISVLCSKFYMEHMRYKD